MRRRKGQSILEYVIVFTVIIAAIMVAANTVMKKAITGAVNDAASSVQGSTSRLPGAGAGSTSE
jgi:hypothetical protein